MESSFHRGRIALLAVVSLALLPSLVPAQTAATPARPAPAPKPLTEIETQAASNYDKLVQAYMKGQWDTLAAQLKLFSSNYRMLDALNKDARPNIEWIRKAAAEQRPVWWEKTKNESNTTFQSTIWNRPITTNYVPADELGMDAPVEIRDGHLITIVSWRPTMVDNPRPADGAIAKALSITKGDIGEVIVWHELGHNYITSALTADQALELYRDFLPLFGTLQEFFADMTALAHCSAKARPCTLILRIGILDPMPPMKYRELEPHTRGSHGIASMFLNEVLSDPSKWPNVHLPPTVPTENVELATVAYVYSHWSPEWSFAEEKQLHDWSQKFVMTQGATIFRSKGKIALKDNLTFSLMEAQDRTFQAKRDAWIATKLHAAIDSGRADKPEVATTQPEKGTTVRTIRIVGPGGMDTRIDVPDY